MKTDAFIILILLTLLSLSSCQKGNVAEITGNLPEGYEGKMVYLTDRSGNTVDSVTVNNNQFSLTMEVPERGNVLFAQYDNMKSPIVFVVEKGKIHMDITDQLLGDNSQWYYVYTLTGGDMNKALIDFKAGFDSIFETSVSTYKKFDEEANASGGWNADLYNKKEKMMAGVIADLENHIINKAKEYSSLSLGEYIINGNLFYVEDKSKLTGLLPLFSQEFQQSKDGERIKKQIEAYSKTRPGMDFIDIKGLTPDGKELKLSDIAGKGKIVYLDFWASLCGPCRREIPGLKEIYNEYKDKGFEVVCVSLDNQKDNWLKAINDEGIDSWWHISNLAGFDEPAAAPYGIMSIPNTYLLNQDGKIVANNIPGYILREEIKQLLQ